MKKRQITEFILLNIIVFFAICLAIILIIYNVKYLNIYNICILGSQILFLIIFDTIESIYLLKKNKVNVLKKLSITFFDVFCASYILYYCSYLPIYLMWIFFGIVLIILSLNIIFVNIGFKKTSKSLFACLFVSYLIILNFKYILLL